MKNLGKANVKVEILEDLPGMIKDPTEFNFDITASQWDSIVHSPYFPPQLTEHVQDDNGSFSAIFPTRRKYYVDNYMNIYAPSAEGANAAPPPNLTSSLQIEWKPINDYTNKGVVTDIANKYPVYTLIPPGQPTVYGYSGPEWTNIREYCTPTPSDRENLLAWSRSLSAPDVNNYITTLVEGTNASNGARDNKKLDAVNWIHQQKALDGLWWGIESNNFLPLLKRNSQIITSMPFCVNIKILGRPSPRASTLPVPTPTPGDVPVGGVTKNFDTQFIISLGASETEHQFDIVLKQNAKPYILDYTLGRYSSGNTSSVGSTIIMKEFENDLSRLWDSQDEIEVCVMTIAGRLVVWVNKVYMIYTRVNKEAGDNAGTIKECQIAHGGISVYGSNVQAKINVCPLVFAPFGFFAMPITSVIQNANSEPISINYQGVSNRGVIGGSVSKLPQPPEVQGVLYGVDSDVFEEVTATIGGSAPIMPNIERPRGFAFHCMGKIYFIRADAAQVSSSSNSHFYIVAMESKTIPIDVIANESSPLRETALQIKNWACPFYFRLKGAHRRNFDIISPEGLFPEVLSVTESVSAPDYFHATASASVVIYNKGGTYDYLREKQYGIKISWGWGVDDDLVQTFVGVIVSATNSEVAGKETLTLQCEDYMFILKNTPIINSPFYDGMVAFYAIADLAKRGGVQTVINQINSSDDYFLPSGYTFSQPKMRFPSSNMIFQCITELTKRFEVFVYFDGWGQLRVFGLPGGLFSETAGELMVAEFARDPNQVEVSNIILNERNVEYNFASTVNEINVLSVERDSRNAILYIKGATPLENNLMYRRVYLGNQAALGDLESVRTWSARLAKRMFYPIRRTSFMTVGNANMAVSNILSFVKVDGLEYRVMSMSKKYDAANNDFTVEYTTEWLGGQ